MSIAMPEETGPITAALALEIVPVLPVAHKHATNAAAKILRRIIGQPLLLLWKLAVSST
jgi:hypothetical protein